MIIQTDHKFISSFLLFIDHEIQKQGLAYQNYSGQFYRMSGNIQGSYPWASPFKQLCNDTSISGAVVLSGLYLNNNFVNVGQSGLVSINHAQGTAYFNTQLPNNTIVSGNYAIKDFNIEFTDQPEYKLLFETKYVTNNKYNQILSGLAIDTKTSPAIFVKVSDTENKPWAFQRLDNNSIKIRAVVVADNEFQRVGVCNILKNLNYRRIPIYRSTPFDQNGAYTGLNYNYDGLTLDTTYEPWILSARVITLANKGNSDATVNPNKNVAFVDFEMSTIMSHF